MAKIVEERITLIFSKLRPNRGKAEKIVSPEDVETIQAAMDELFEEDGRVIEVISTGELTDDAGAPGESSEDGDD